MNSYSALIFAAAAAISSAVSAQRFEDHTMIRRLDLSENRTAPPVACPSGSVLSGGACVPLQAGAPASWVSGFLGQQKCYSSHCVTIESNGRVFYGAGWDNLRTTAPPIGLTPVQFEGGSCGDNCTPARIFVEPTLNNNSMALTGGTPNGWRFCFIDHYNRLTPCTN